ncbi:MAG: Ig-like domain-containing protein [Oscillospiraceae bacterium]|nr:Ig-like domain-containing protein [Oscillospiraceae bacterium]
MKYLKYILSVGMSLLIFFGLFAGETVALGSAVTPVKRITLTVGEIHQLKIINRSGGPVTWRSSNTTVAAVSRLGRVAAKAPGAAIITAVTSTNTLRCIVTVKEPPAVLSGVTIVGDSTSLGAKSTLESIIPNSFYDGAVSRTINTGRDMIFELQEKGLLREYVVVALGTNGHNNYEALFTQIIDGIKPGHRIIFVTPFDGRANENSTWTRRKAEWMRDLPRRYDFITIADWSALIAPQAHVLAPDMVHMGGQTSMTLYAECVAQAIKEAEKKPAKR